MTEIDIGKALAVVVGLFGLALFYLGWKQPCPICEVGDAEIYTYGAEKCWHCGRKVKDGEDGK